MQQILCNFSFVSTVVGMADSDTPQSAAPRITDLAALKVFTHPLRVELWHALQAAGTATASQLAERVDEAVSLVSYHLRKMAEHGFIQQADGHGGDGRERWWRLTDERAFAFRTSDFDDRPEGSAVAQEVTRLLLRRRSERYAAFLDERTAWSREWSDAAFSQEHTAWLTAAELAELEGEIAALARRWAERGRSSEAADGSERAAEETEHRERVALHFYGFPYRS